MYFAILAFPPKYCIYHRSKLQFFVRTNLLLLSLKFQNPNENNNSSVKLPFIQSKIKCIGYEPVATILLLIALGILFWKIALIKTQKIDIICKYNASISAIFVLLCVQIACRSANLSGYLFIYSLSQNHLRPKFLSTFLDNNSYNPTSLLH